MGNQVIAYPPQRWDLLYGAYVVVRVLAHFAAIYWRAFWERA